MLLLPPPAPYHWSSNKSRCSPPHGKCHPPTCQPPPPPPRGARRKAKYLGLCGQISRFLFWQQQTFCENSAINTVLLFSNLFNGLWVSSATHASRHLLPESSWMCRGVELISWRWTFLFVPRSVQGSRKRQTLMLVLQLQFQKQW